MRSTFSLSKSDLEGIEAIRALLARRGHILNKSEVVRLALICLEGDAPRRHKALIEELDRLRPGRRPAKHPGEKS